MGKPDSFLVTFAYLSESQQVLDVYIDKQTESRLSQRISGGQERNMERPGAKRVKLSKKVTWSLQLIDVKVMTPQPTMYEQVADIIFLEEEEDMLEDEVKSENFTADANEA